jgi:hypothetical protein
MLIQDFLDVTGTRGTPIYLAPPDNSSLSRKRPRSSSVASSVTVKREFMGSGTHHGSAAVPRIKLEPKIKQEPIDVDSLEDDEIMILPLETIKHQYDLTLDDKEEAGGNKVKEEANLEDGVESLDETMDDAPTENTPLTEDELRWIQEDQEEMERAALENAETQQRLAAFEEDSEDE